jgi:hypothetical protein
MPGPDSKRRMPNSGPNKDSGEGSQFLTGPSKTLPPSGYGGPGLALAINEKFRVAISLLKNGRSEGIHR